MVAPPQNMSEYMFLFL